MLKAKIIAQTLCKLTEGGNRQFRPHNAKAQLETLQCLHNAGLWHNDGVVSDIICDMCDEPHLAEIIPLPKGRYGWFCSNTGRYYIADDETVARGAWRYDVIAARLADALDIPKNELKDADNGIWHLGRPSIKGVKERAFFMPCLQDAQDTEALNAAIMRLSRPVPDMGIVLTCAGDVPAVYRLEQNYRIIPLADVLTIDENGTFIITEHDIAAYFPDKHAEPLYTSQGRPSFKTQLQAIINPMRAEGKLVPDNKSESARRIIKAYEQHYPGQKAPSEKTVRDFLHKMETTA